MESCEPAYLDSKYLQQFWGVCSSLTFLIPAFCRLVLLKSRPISSKVKRVYLSLVCLAVASSLFHSYVSFITQAIDISVLLIVVLSYVEAAGMPLSPYQEVFMVLSYFTILLSPVLTLLNIGLLALQVSLFTVKKYQEPSGTALRVMATGSKVTMAGALLCLWLDLKCSPGGLYHAYWQLFLAASFFSGATAVELHDLALVKSD
jgi:hypothetical protein